MAYNKKHDMTVSFMKSLITKSEDEILFVLNNEKCGFKDFLNDPSKNKQSVELAIQLIAEACYSRNKGGVRKLLNLVHDHEHTFFLKDALHVIYRGVIEKNVVNLPKLGKSYLFIVKHMLKELKLYPMARRIFFQFQNYINQYKDSNPHENLNEIESILKSIDQELDRQSLRLLNMQNADEKPPESFREIAVFPESVDVLNCKISFLRANIIDKSYNDVEHYLDIHYRLLREDMLIKLRTSIASLLTKNRTLQGSLDDCEIYSNLVLSYPPNYSPDGILHTIKVECPVSVDWAKTKRLLSSSVICLSSDSFKSVVFAIITRRAPEGGVSKKCELSVIIEDGKAEIPESTNYCMIESASYAESYLHSLKVLKEYNEQNFPLSDFIVYLDFDDTVPEYLFVNSEFCLHENCDYKNADGSAGKSGACEEDTCKMFNVLKLDEWPSSEELKLDRYQLSAFQTALTKKVALIQGPPGTGKTFLGIKIVRAILHNVSHKPIVICCATNHALDQFLLLISKYTQKIVRMGWQSKCEALDAYKLKNMLCALKKFRYDGASCVDDMLPEVKASLETIDSLCSTLFETQPRVIVDRDRSKLIDMCNDINKLMSEINKCAQNYLEDEALNMIIDLTYKQILCEGTGKNVLSKGVMEWLCINKKSISEFKTRMNNFEAAGVFDCETDDLFELKEITDIWATTKEKRFKLFYYWRKKCLDILQADLKEKLDLYNIFLQKTEKNTNSDAYELLKAADVIGMTLTGASKFRSVIKDIRPKIMIIEEAAESFEVHVISALVPSIEHMILIGDHKQLRPISSDPELDNRFNFNISLFERLFKNSAPSATLVSQHRMRPCIAELLVPDIYECLESSESVLKYENVKGMKHNMFFFKHSEKEDDQSFGKSSSNSFEASFITELANFLVVQGYDCSQITILTTYAAQLPLIQKNFNENTRNIYVTTVDNYQGEENDIILISFVRSNNRKIIGFLKESNRVCVALSRAKKGLYCVGNFNMLADASPLWSNMVEKLEMTDMIGDELPLQCYMHGEIKYVSKTDDFEQFIQSGCYEVCEYVLPCGHTCKKSCHFENMDHKHVLCKEPCDRLIDPEKQRYCTRRCCDPCEKRKKKHRSYIDLPCGHRVMSDKISDKDINSYICREEMPKLLPCEHVDTLPCYAEPKIHPCGASVSVTLNCGHKSVIACHKKKELANILCTELVQYVSVCGHTVYIPCNLKPDNDILLAYCTKSCDSLLRCGHACTGLCRWCTETKIHAKCMYPCKEKLQCGHTCEGFCGAPCTDCKRKCQLRCAHDIQCLNPCTKSCVKCENSCVLYCKHKQCSRQCFEPCDVTPCNEPCDEILECKHRCIGLCGDLCPDICRVCDSDMLKSQDPKKDRYVLLEDCNHIIEIHHLTGHIKCLLDIFEWPACPDCCTSITKSNRFNNELKKAKQLCIISNSNEQKELVDKLNEEGSRFDSWRFQDIYLDIERRLKHETLTTPVLTVLKTIISCLKDLVSLDNKISDDNEKVKNSLDSLLLWISNHLEKASFQQLEELEESISSLNQLCA